MILGFNGELPMGSVAEGCAGLGMEGAKMRTSVEQADQADQPVKNTGIFEDLRRSTY